MRVPAGILMLALAAAFANGPAGAQTAPATQGTPAPAAPPVTVPATGSATVASFPFVTHAAFFSQETGRQALVDPQVFVNDPKAPAATGPQGITHVPAYRPALGTDLPDNALANALGVGIKTSLGSWLKATGTAVFTAVGNTATRVDVAFSGLIKDGRYSLFENHFSPTGVTFTPLDGTGLTNSFTASPDGTAKLTVIAPGAITHGEAVLLVYHSDGLDHRADRGEPGVTAHHQLIVRLP